MAYGFSAKGSGEVYQVSTDTTTTINCAIYQKGNGTYISAFPVDSANDIVFAKGRYPHSGVQSTVQKGYVEYNGNRNFSAGNAVDYIVLKNATQAEWAQIASASLDSHGLQIKNSANPSKVIFDSRFTNLHGGFAMFPSAQINALTGGTSATEYDTPHFSTGMTSTSNNIYIGNLTNKWVCVTGSKINFTTSIVNGASVQTWETLDDDGEGYLRGGYVYEFNANSMTTGRIYYRSFHQFKGFNAQSGWPSNPRRGGWVIGKEKNLGDIILGEFKA